MYSRAARFKMTIVTLGRITLLLLMFTITIPRPADAAVLFDSDFESGSGATDFLGNGWNDFGTAQVGNLELSTDFALSGTRAVKATVTDVNGSALQPAAYKNVPLTDRLFLRFGHRESVGFQVGSNGATKKIRVLLNNGYPKVWIYHKYGVYGLEVEAPYFVLGTGGVPVTTLFQGGSRVPSQTSWDQIEVEYLLNTPGQSNGLLRMWVNGTLDVELLNKQWRGPTDASVAPSGQPTPASGQIQTIQIFVQSGLGSFYIDRLAAGNTRIGMTTGAPPTDIAPPASPTGLQVR